MMILHRITFSTPLLVRLRKLSRIIRDVHFLSKEKLQDWYEVAIEYDKALVNGDYETARQLWLSN